MKKWSKRMGRGLLAIVVLLVILRMVLPSIIVRVANSKMGDLLEPVGRLGDCDLSVLTGGVTLEGLNIGQPIGFGEGSFVSVKQASVDVAMLSLLRGPLTVQNITLNGANVHIAKSKEGVLNAAKLTKPAPAASASAPAPPKEGEGARPVVIEKLTLEGLTFRYTDLSVGDKPLDVTVTNINVVLNNLVIDEAAVSDKKLPGDLLLTAQIVQKPVAAEVGLNARIGAVGADIPALNAVLRVVGLELAPLSAVVPLGVKQSLGGDCLDLKADVAMATNVLDCTVGVQTAGAKLTLAIGGTPSEPVPDKSSALYAVCGRLGGGLGNVVGNVGQAGAELANTAVETAGTVGKGAARTVGKVGSGLFDTVKSAVKGDVRKATEGLKKSTVGAATEAVNTVKDTSKGVQEGAVQTAKKTLGGKREEEWRAARQQRWTEEWATARGALMAMPFPEPKAESGRDAGQKDAPVKPVGGSAKTGNAGPDRE